MIRRGIALDIVLKKLGITTAVTRHRRGLVLICPSVHTTPRLHT